EGAILAERHSAQIVIVADTGEDEILILGGLGRCRRGLAGAILLDPRLGLGGIAVVDGQLMAALLEKVPGHGIAHYAQSDKRHLRHRAAPMKSLTVREPC